MKFRAEIQKHCYDIIDSMALYDNTNPLLKNKPIDFDQLERVIDVSLKAIAFYFAKEKIFNFIKGSGTKYMKGKEN